MEIVDEGEGKGETEEETIILLSLEEVAGRCNSTEAEVCVWRVSFKSNTLRDACSTICGSVCLSSLRKVLKQKGLTNSTQKKTR